VHSETRDKWECEIWCTFVGQVGARAVKNGKQCDSCIFMATTEHDDIL
jgi:hypothetical protein